MPINVIKGTEQAEKQIPQPLIWHLDTADDDLNLYCNGVLIAYVNTRGVMRALSVTPQQEAQFIRDGLKFVAGKLVLDV